MKDLALTYHLEQGEGHVITVVCSRYGGRERWAYGRWNSPADAMEARPEDFHEMTPAVERAYVEWLAGARRNGPGENCVVFVPVES